MRRVFIMKEPFVAAVLDPDQAAQQRYSVVYCGSSEERIEGWEIDTWVGKIILSRDIVEWVWIPPADWAPDMVNMPAHVLVLN